MDQKTESHILRQEFTQTFPKERAPSLFTLSPGGEPPQGWILRNGLIHQKKEEGVVQPSPLR